MHTFTVLTTPYQCARVPPPPEEPPVASAVAQRREQPRYSGGVLGTVCREGGGAVAVAGEGEGSSEPRPMPTCACACACTSTCACFPSLEPSTPKPAALPRILCPEYYADPGPGHPSPSLSPSLNPGPGPIPRLYRTYRRWEVLDTPGLREAATELKERVACPDRLSGRC